MAQKLTKEARVEVEKRRISRLTNPHKQHFKVILSHQIMRRYCFGSMRSRPLTPAEALKVWNAFGNFMDKTVRMTITDVENAYKRTSDTNDGTHDPETGLKVQVEHFCFFLDGDEPKGASDNVRVHGYFRAAGGYFIVTRLDWFHQYHSGEA